LIPSLTLACFLLMPLPQARAAQRAARPPEQKHLQLTLPEGGGSVTLSANSMERDLSTGKTASVVRLRGNVIIKAPSIAPGHYVILHAAQATYNETTGEVRALGQVRVELQAAPPETPSR
jgi:lipopolysaccharide assembly outer membrane protein LptD (OstA)